MRSRAVGAMGCVGRGGWGVSAVPVPAVWSGERSTLELSGSEAFALNELLGFLITNSDVSIYGLPQRA